MRKLVLFLALCSSQVWAFSAQDLISIDCKASNGVSIKTYKWEDGQHVIETQWFGMRKLFTAQTEIVRDGNEGTIFLKSVDQTYFMEGKLDRSNPSQSVTFDLYAKHPAGKIFVTKAHCILDFKRN